MPKDPMDRIRETEQRILVLETILSSFITRLASAQPDPDGQIRAMKTEVLSLIAAVEPDLPAGDGSRDVVGNSHTFAADFFDDIARYLARGTGVRRGPAA